MQQHKKLLYSFSYWAQSPVWPLSSSSEIDLFINRAVQSVIHYSLTRFEIKCVMLHRPRRDWDVVGLAESSKIRSHHFFVHFKNSRRRIAYSLLMYHKPKQKNHKIIIINLILCSIQFDSKALYSNQNL